MAVLDDKIATAIAKLHADGAILEASLVETVVDFLNSPIDDAEVLNFRIAVSALREEMKTNRTCDE